MSPEVEDVMVVIVVAVVLREEQAVPRRTPSRTSSAWWGLIFEFPAISPAPPLSESESDESPVNGTDRIWLARYNKHKTHNETIGKTKAGKKVTVAFQGCIIRWIEQRDIVL